MSSESESVGAPAIQLETTELHVEPAVSKPAVETASASAGVGGHIKPAAAAAPAVAGAGAAVTAANVAASANKVQAAVAGAVGSPAHLTQQQQQQQPPPPPPPQQQQHPPQQQQQQPAKATGPAVIGKLVVPPQGAAAAGAVAAAAAGAAADFRKEAALGDAGSANDVCPVSDAKPADVVLIQFQLSVLAVLVLLILISWRRYGSMISALYASPTVTTVPRT
eukprot:TRINITY_DN1412_c0_g2_i2.p1 TRINITY_DN1412_c0_g2~~TRINITY_DN1412_c0_g2_i2.p1  ORF type:complete len:237 (-),score=99.16 TRINITY_DN1412_c0_g2_i2:520-1185(-)